MAKRLCTICHKSEDEAIAILALSDDLNICDECIFLMAEIVAEGHAEWRVRLINALQKSQTDPPPAGDTI
jgi:hypothetical protein